MPKRYHTWLVLLLAAASIALRFAFLDSKPLWNDEAFSVRVADATLWQTVWYLAQDLHPPLYFLILNLWLSLGKSELIVRSLSAILGTGAVLMTYLLARQLTNRSGALMAALLVATSPWFVSWSQIARPYALLAFSTIGVLWATACIVNVVSRSTTPIDDLPGDADIGQTDDVSTAHRFAGYCAAYVGFSIAAFYTHNLAVLLAIVTGLFVLVVMLKHGNTRRRQIMWWLAANTVVLLCWLPWIPVIVAQLNRLSGSPYEPDLNTAFESLSAALGAAYVWSLKPIFLVVLIGLMTAGCIVGRRRPAIMLCAVCVFAPVLMCIILFNLGYRTFDYAAARLMWVPACVAVLVTIGVFASRRRIVRWLAVAVLMSLQLKAVTNWYQMSTPPWDDLVDYLVVHSCATDAILADMRVDRTAHDRLRYDSPMHALPYYLDQHHAETKPRLPSVIPPWERDRMDFPSFFAKGGSLWIPKTSSRADREIVNDATSALNEIPDIQINVNRFAGLELYRLSLRLLRPAGAGCPRP